MKRSTQTLIVLLGMMSILSMLVFAAPQVAPGLRIKNYPRATTLNESDVFVVENVSVVPNINNSIEWRNMKKITNDLATRAFVSNYVNSATNITGNVPVGYQTNAWTTNVAGTPVIGESSLSISNATTNFNFYGLNSNTVARLWEIGTATNALLVALTNYVNTSTNGFGIATVWTNNGGIIHPLVSNGQQTNSIQVYTNGGLSIGANTLAYWGTQPGTDGETMVSSRASTDDPYNEVFLRYLDGTNELHQDFFMQTGINLWTISFNDMQMRAEVDGTSNYVFRATSGSDHVWRFNPASGDRYTFDTPFPVAASEALAEFGNKGTNKLTLYGGNGNLNIVGQITNQFLSVSKLVKSDADKGLISSTLDETGITNLINTLITAATNALTVSAPLTPGVTNVASTDTIVIDLAATNTPIVSVTNTAAHNISIVVSNPYPGRWFSFYIDGSGVATNNNLTWSSVAGVQLKWLDAVTNTLVLSNGFVNVSGWIATMNRNTNMVITYRDE